MKSVKFAAFACLLVGACNAPPTKTADTTTTPLTTASLPAVDYAVWRDVEPGKLAASLAFMCAGGLDDLGRADATLHGSAALQVPWSVQVTRKGKMQAQCVWTGPSGRTGRVVIDVLCKNDDNDRCSRFAYGIEGTRKISAVPMVRRSPPPISTTYPPGRDDVERTRSEAILSWARDHAADQIGALRAEIHGAKVGINVDAKIPVLCGQVREAGKNWRRFAVYSLGAASGSGETFHWLSEPHDRKAIGDFCDVKDADLQWYAVSDSKVSG